MDAVDLREYFPSFKVITLNKSSGSTSTRYTLQASPTGIDSLYSGYMNLNKPGSPYMWRKEYWRNGSWCTDTYAVLFMGDDKSVTEVGDWYAGSPCTPNVALGYKSSTGVTNGLLWSGPGGLSDTPVLIETNVWRQNTPGSSYLNSGYKAYSRTGIIEKLDSYTPPFGRNTCGVWEQEGGKEFLDVIHLVMYHGTKVPNGTQIRCVGPLSANGAYYQSFKDYNSYAIELWLAKGIGIIQENCPFIEDASAWGGTISNCSGDIFANPVGSWKTYIDI